MLEEEGGAQMAHSSPPDRTMTWHLPTQIAECACNRGPTWITRVEIICPSQFNINEFTFVKKIYIFREYCRYLHGKINLITRQGIKESGVYTHDCRWKQTRIGDLLNRNRGKKEYSSLQPGRNFYQDSRSSYISEEDKLKLLTCRVEGEELARWGQGREVIQTGSTALECMVPVPLLVTPSRWSGRRVFVLPYSTMNEPVSLKLPEIKIRGDKWIL